MKPNKNICRSCKKAAWGKKYDKAVNPSLWACPAIVGEICTEEFALGESEDIPTNCLKKLEQCMAAALEIVNIDKKSEIKSKNAV